jgi:hypothetical protein
VLYRALSLNPRHRYQRAFVLREDLRGLMAGYSFSTIVDDTRHFIGQIIDSQFEGGQYDSGIHHSPVQTGDTDRRAAEALADSAALRDGLKVAASNPDEEHTEPPHPVEDLLLDVSIHDQPTESASEAILSALRAEVFTEDPPSTVEYSPLSERVTEDLPDGDLPDGDLDLDEEQDPDSEQEPGAAAVMVMPSRPSEVAPDPRDEPELDEAEDSLFEPSSEQATEQAAEQATGLQPSQDESEVTDILPGMLFDPSTADDEPPLPRPLLAEDEVFDPNSTAGFLRGHQPASPRPPSVEPSPRIAAAPPPVSIAERAPPPVSITERAPPPVRPRRVEPAPQPEADLDEPTPRSRVPMMALVAAAALVVVCGGGSALVWGAYSALRGGEELAAVTPAQKPPVTAPAREPAEEPITAEETAEDALAAAQPVEEPVRPEPTRTEPVRPEPVRPASSSSASSSSAASSSAASSSAASSRTEPTSRPTSAPASSARTVAEDDSLAFLDDDDGRSMEPIEAEPVELDRYTQAAARGSLNRSDILALETVDFSDDDFTRSRALLLMNAQRSNDERATRQYLEELMRKPENQYNPVFLTDYARYYANRGSFSRALEQANLAERHWQRLPSELIFVKKAEIYEIQAASYQGLFYDSDSDTDLLLRSIRHWEKLKEHVQGRDSARTAQADAELAKLRDIQRRLEN